MHLFSFGFSDATNDKHSALSIYICNLKQQNVKTSASYTVYASQNVYTPFNIMLLLVNVAI